MGVVGRGRGPITLVFVGFRLQIRWVRQIYGTMAATGDTRLSSRPFSGMGLVRCDPARKGVVMPSDIVLRDVYTEDQSIFFDHQLDAAANHMAAFTSKEPADRDAFAARWTRILADEAITKKTILLDGEVVGHAMSFVQDGKLEVTYWIGRSYWGRGIATGALLELLRQVKTRPLFARAAQDNLASLRVLKKCGFEVVREEKGFANARGEEIEEFVLELKTVKEELV